jgi:flagellar FliL protein
MADPETELEDEAPAKPRSGLIKKLALAFAGVALLAVGIGVGQWVGKLLSEPEAAESAAAADNEAAGETETDAADLAVGGPEFYQSLLPPLVINIADQSGAPHFMQMSMEVMARNQDVANLTREHMAAIRNNLILLYGSASYESVVTREGKEKLLSDGLKEIRKTLEPYGGDGQVAALYFTALVVQ